MKNRPINTLALVALSFFLLTGWMSTDHLPGHGNPETPGARTNPAYLRAVGIGVSELESSVAFYTHGLGMKETTRLIRNNRVEVVMQSADARGSDIVLMQYTDNKARAFDQNPGKIVFYAKDVNQFATNIVSAGGQILLPPTAQPQFDGALVGFARDPDNNLIEMVGSNTATESFMSAFGIGVSDLQGARDFYVQVMGLKEQRYIEIPGQYNEYILESVVPGSSALVLMHWTNGIERNYKNNPVKLEFATGVPVDLAIAIKQSRHPLLQFPRPDKRRNKAIVGYAKDADGTLIEIKRSHKNYLSGAGIGVTDLEAAIQFYTNGLGMKQVGRRLRHNREEVVMESADARGSHLVLMGFNDGKPRNYQQNPGKIVFYVNNTTTFVATMVAAGGQILLPPMPQPELGGVEVGFGRDIDNNLIEIVGVPTANHSYFAAFGIGVIDLEAAKTFYTETLGFKLSQFLSTASYDEYILESTGGSALVLMHWTEGSDRNYRDNPVKLELRSLSPLGAAANIKQSRNHVIQLPHISRDQGMEGAMVGYAKDSDGTLLELLKAPWGSED
ncbi:MAG: VOC family protein [Ketobacter sp.]